MKDVIFTAYKSAYNHWWDAREAGHKVRTFLWAKTTDILSVFA